MPCIYSKFYSLDPEKQERIINAAVDEFVRNGYEKASTNEIVKQANISKGSLFKYFKSKKELYLFLYEHAIKVIDQIYDEMDWQETDFFERLRLIGAIKFNIIKRFPQAFHFIYSFAQEQAIEVRSEIELKGKQIIEEGLGKLYANIDRSKFRDDIDVDKAVQIMKWTLFSYAEEQKKKGMTMDELGQETFAEWDSYSDLLKRCFYKQI